MSDDRFDTDSLFDEDYLYFYEGSLLGPEIDARQTEMLWSLLDLRPGMTVLDLACGHGRIANRLAAKGCRVTGIDTSERFLDMARADAREQGLDVTYLQGDMRDPPAGSGFDRALSWFTSFGYFEDAELRRMITRVRGCLGAGGRFLIDTINRDRILRQFLPSIVREREGDLIIDRHRFEPLTGRLVATRTTVRDGRRRDIPYFVRVVTFTEARDWLLGAGFARVDGLGPDGEAFGLESRRMILVAHA